MDRQLLSSHGPEPVPPPPGPLFESHEVMAFEQFLDDLAIDNSFMFHPKVPASLTWDGFHSTRNKGFEDIKREVQHSGLQFGSDNHFSSDGYIATHKYVPVGYGHVHPQSTAQRSHRSSASSRNVSRRPSIYEGAEPAQPGRHNIADYQSLTVGLPPLLTTPTAPRETSYDAYTFPPSVDYRRYEQQEPSHDIVHKTEPDTDERPQKKIKTEEHTSKQPLTAAQKRQNHITSEQKRRNLIKEGFNELSGLIPKVQSKNESKSVILREAIKYILSNEAENASLRSRIASLRRDLNI